MRDEEFVLLIVIVLSLAITIVVAVFYLMNLQNLLKEIKAHNRTVEPGNVWLMFIPIFNYIYGFILYPKISESLKNEMEERGIGEAGDYGKNLGITMPILNLVGFVPFIGSLAGLANLVIFIVYWVKMAGYKTKLQANPGMGSGIGSSDELLDK